MRTVRQDAIARAFTAALWAAAAAFALSPPVLAASPSRLNVDVVVLGIAGVSDLTASPGTLNGTIDLVWTEPRRNGTTGPYAYDIRASSSGQISTHAQFLAARPLTAFSPSPAPSPGPGGGQAGMVVTGLAPGVVHYFAIRELDSLGAFGHWVRAGPRNLNNFAVALNASSNAPDPVTNLSAVPGSAEGEVALSWTAPRNQNLTPVVSYQLRYAALPVTAFGGSTTAWAAAATTLVFAPALAPGSLETRVVAGLATSSTWYFALKSVDLNAQASDVDVGASGGAQAFSMPRNGAPGAPTGLSAAAGVRRVTLSWTDLSPAGKGSDFAHYRLERSLNDVVYVAVTTVAAPGHLDVPLTANVTYYYRVAARDLAGFESLSSTVSATPFAPPPMEPLGLRATSDSTSTVVTWSAVTRFEDGTAFFAPATPAPDELQGYRVMRATVACAPSFVLHSTMSAATTGITDNSMGLNYFYRINSFNTQGVSTNSVTLSSLGEVGFYLDDCETAVLLDDDAAALVLNASSNGLGANVRIVGERRPQDVGGTIFQSVSWRPYLDGVTPLDTLVLPEPARVRLRYDVDASGAPTPSTAPYTGAGVAAAALAPAAGVAAGASDLGVYWHNGAEFKKMYGKVDPLTQTVTVQSPNLGLYQIRALQRAQGAVFDLSNLSSRVITPNGDGLNDVVIFTYDPGPNSPSVTGKVYDIRGAFVADMRPGLVPNTLTWDGRMGGAPASSGVYVYRVSGDGKTFTGTVVVAR